MAIVILSQMNIYFGATDLINLFELPRILELLTPHTHPPTHTQVTSYIKVILKCCGELEQMFYCKNILYQIIYRYYFHDHGRLCGYRQRWSSDFLCFFIHNVSPVGDNEFRNGMYNRTELTSSSLIHLLSSSSSSFFFSYSSGSRPDIYGYIYVQRCY